MQAPTNNSISQGKHGTYNAVDYDDNPDLNIYAPEDGTITAQFTDVRCGNAMQLTGATGRHGFCHLEKYEVANGARVTRGQKIGVMGYTGYTEPKGINGRHLHWVLYRNGVYVYPPSLVNETFKQGDNKVAIVKDEPNWFARLNKLHRQVRGRDISRSSFLQFVGKDTLFVIEKFSDDAEADKVQEAQQWALANRASIEKQVADLKTQLANEGTVLTPGKYLVK